LIVILLNDFPMKKEYSDQRILIVDDELANTSLLESFLKINGFNNYSSTNDSREVARLVKETNPDLILLDLMMPYISGIQILEWLKTEGYLDSPLRVMVLTADITKETLKEALKAGAHDLLTKPFELAELELRIGNMLHTNTLIKRLNNQALHLEALVESRTLELEQKNEELEQFIFVASHDTQEPLRMITGFLQLLEKKYSDKLDEKGKEYIHYAVEGSARMKSMIKDMLDFSRAGKLGPKDFESVDLNEVMDDVLLGLKRIIDEKHALIEVEKLPNVTGINVPIRQVFQNIITNAIIYQPEGQQPKIRVTWVKSADDTFVIQISDNGIGIPADKQKKIFELFTRLQPKDQYPGSGIGLSISRKMMERMHGAIDVQSSPGQGSQFSLHFKKY